MYHKTLEDVNYSFEREKTGILYSKDMFLWLADTSFLWVVFVETGKSNYSFVNKRFLEDTGYSFREAVQMPIVDFLHASAKKEAKDIIESVLVADEKREEWGSVHVTQYVNKDKSQIMTVKFHGDFNKTKTGYFAIGEVIDRRAFQLYPKSK